MRTWLPGHSRRTNQWSYQAKPLSRLQKQLINHIRLYNRLYKEYVFHWIYKWHLEKYYADLFDYTAGMLTTEVIMTDAFNVISHQISYLCYACTLSIILLDSHERCKYRFLCFIIYNDSKTFITNVYKA